MVWQRPSSVAYPAVWSRCVGKKALPSGKLQKFRIQDAPPEMYEEVLDHMTSIYLREAPISAYAKVADDPVCLAELRDVLSDAFHKKMGLVALLEEEDGTTKLAGVNLTFPSSIEDKKKTKEVQGEGNRVLFGLMQHMYDVADVFGHYGVTEYLTAMGLSVAPEYRGQGLGLELLLARIPLCRATGMAVTCAIFTPAVSQELARRAGFEVLAQLEYKDYKKDGKEVFPGIKEKLCKLMALKIS